MLNIVVNISSSLVSSSSLMPIHLRLNFFGKVIMLAIRYVGETDSGVMFRSVHKNPTALTLSISQNYFTVSFMEGNYIQQDVTLFYHVIIIQSYTFFIKVHVKLNIFFFSLSLHFGYVIVIQAGLYLPFIDLNALLLYLFHWLCLLLRHTI